MQMQNPSLKEQALKYATSGMPIFPLLPGSKKPATPRGFKDATTDAATVSAWWTQNPNANIGLPTGEASGLYVVDIDGPEGEDALKALEAKHGALPDTLISKTGRGTHYIFKTSEPIKNTAGALGPKIDTRGTGGYIVAPPSLHPNGERYRWERRTAPAELPAWLRPAKREPVQQPLRLARVESLKSDDMARASAYLAAMPAAIQGASGHNALLSAACTLVNGFDLSHGEAFTLLANEFNPRCVPAWDLSNTTDRKDFERKITQAAGLSHESPRGHLLGDNAEVQAEIAHGAAQAARFIAAQTSEAPRPATPRPKKQQAAEVAGFPDHLLKPSGMLGELCAWMDSGAIRKQPILSIAAAISFAGVLFGRKIQDEYTSRTNIYALGIAESGAGKDHARKCLKALCLAVDGFDGAGNLLGGEEVTSDVAIANSFTRNASRLFLFDEVGHMIAGTKSKNASTHQAAIMVMLTKLFSSANASVKGKELSLIHI
jgi:hypothetical protein